MRWAGRMGTDEPPATTAFSFRPRRIPPQYSSEKINSSTGRPNSISYTPGLLICPQAEINLVPLLFPTPILAYSDPPILMMCGTAAMLSTLFTTVGHPHKPETAGNGGLILGLPRFPSNDSIKAVSSPQI